ncbi:MAG: GSU2403 family nucleotidyltransferase fold protein [Pseudomonadota bacterium]
MKPIATTFRTLFADLEQKARNAPLAGSVYERERDGVLYTYAKIPVGSTRVDTFIGKSDNALTQQQAEELRRGMETRRENRKIVSLLKSAGFANFDPTMGAILDSIAHARLFREGAVLVGTAAYTASEAHVGSFLPEPTVMTGDVDIATTNLAISADPPEPMIAILQRADSTFEPVMQIDPQKPPSRFRNRHGYFVDIVTPTRRATDTNPLPLKRLKAGAAPLQQLDWLIENPVPTVALWDHGIPINIPQPARLAVHKLMLAQNRGPTDRLKREKDLRQADALMTALYASDPFGLEAALDDARRRGKRGWSQKIDRSMAELSN